MTTHYRIGGELGSTFLVFLKLLFCLLLLSINQYLYALQNTYTYIGGDLSAYTYYLSDIENLSIRSACLDAILAITNTTDTDITDACIAQQDICDNALKRQWLFTGLGQAGVGYMLKPYLAGEINYWRFANPVQSVFPATKKNSIPDVSKMTLMQGIILLVKLKKPLFSHINIYAQSGIGLCDEISTFSDPKIEEDIEEAGYTQYKTCFVSGMGIQVRTLPHWFIDTSWRYLMTNTHHYNSFHFGIYLTY